MSLQRYGRRFQPYLTPDTVRHLVRGAGSIYRMYRSHSGSSGGSVGSWVRRTNPYSGSRGSNSNPSRAQSTTSGGSSRSAGTMGSNITAHAVGKTRGAKRIYKKKSNIKKSKGQKRKAKAYKSFSKKVRKIVNGDRPFGYHNITQFQTFPQVTTNQWTTYGGTDAGQNYEFFQPAQFKDAEAVCFNNKTPVLNGYQNTTVGIAGNFDTNSKTFVSDSYVDYKFVNTSQFPTFVEMYICSAKKGNRTGVLAGLAVNQHPLANWENLGNQVDLVGDSLAPTSLNSCAAQAVGMNANWDYKLVKMKLEPAQVVTHRIQGPKNYTFDASTKLVPGQINGLTDPVFTTFGNPGSGKVVFFRVITELALDSGGTPAHTKHVLNTGIGVRWTMYYKLRGPTQDQESKIDNTIGSLVTVTGLPNDTGTQIERDIVG